MTDAYQVDMFAKNQADRYNRELAKCRHWYELAGLIERATDQGFAMCSKRRPAVIIFHIQKASIQRNGEDLALYLVDDGVHAGACAVPNMHKNFYFRVAISSRFKRILG